MSPISFTVTASPSRFPRVSGDEPSIPARIVMRRAFSPRERG